ncbi:MAG: hypothetical protein WAM39_26820, partial [Bryobacteraceae bacterium]
EEKWKANSRPPTFLGSAIPSLNPTKKPKKRTPGDEAFASSPSSFFKLQGCTPSESTPNSDSYQFGNIS